MGAQRNERRERREAEGVGKGRDASILDPAQPFERDRDPADEAIATRPPDDIGWRELLRAAAKDLQQERGEIGARELVGEKVERLAHPRLPEDAVERRTLAVTHAPS